MVVLCFTLTLLAQLVLPAHTFHNSNSSDQDALLAFKNSLSLDPSNSLREWSPNYNFCSWAGVGCSSCRPRVTSLTLTGMGLVGPISPFQVDLSFLTVLDLFNNSFQGQIPPQLGRLFRLRSLRLSFNQLEGVIPSALADCPLDKLGLSYNKLEGLIPSSLGGCHSLQILILSSNNLSGNIPYELGHLQKLEILWLDSNQLTGIIPPFFGNMSSLSQLTLGNNRLHESVPVELGRLTRLQVLTLRLNTLTGPIPIALSKCTNLQI
ncbi:hypothetical protein SUGI_0376610 [Cryptomeria japonica]|uniref:LRR receptor-like serine/threonine-protein kinase GSO1 n=1 Tax=Cryptomeria japonica TaxID=3369 RepID=UPI002408BFFE|nr:LRR receptor-like serine/threonine-protein kinase GSO1 [Cryptomeria japonica]GLJ20674.1 hypothetical protein SUGI_0376610 [Cryptomeria japonica]